MVLSLDAETFMLAQAPQFILSTDTLLAVRFAAGKDKLLSALGAFGPLSAIAEGIHPSSGRQPARHRKKNAIHFLIVIFCVMEVILLLGTVHTFRRAHRGVGSCACDTKRKTKAGDRRSLPDRPVVREEETYENIAL
jgi:hypothetical protein